MRPGTRAAVDRGYTTFWEVNVAVLVGQGGQRTDPHRHLGTECTCTGTVGPSAQLGMWQKSRTQVQADI